MLLRVAVVEDEPLAMSLILRWLRECAQLEVVGTAESFDAANRLLKKSEPDVVFLDINLAGENGFCIAEAGRQAKLFEVVFVSAHGDYALPAFRVDAADFLKKPFTRDQLHESINRARQRILMRRQVAGEPTALRLRIRDGNKIEMVPAAEVLWIESAGGYSVVHTSMDRHVTRDSLESLLSQLGPPFVRVHRSVLMNSHFLSSVHALAHGDALLRLSSGTELRMSRRYRAELEKIGFL